VLLSFISFLAFLLTRTVAVRAARYGLPSRLRMRSS
jgi:hypothetical protein